MNKIIKPDFLIVGAPKCGTTALNDFLSQHPEINLIEKELHFFGRDLNIKKNTISKESYFSQFKPNRLNGDASVWYLYSDSIFDELKAIEAYPKIIIMLRNPIDFMHSLHSQNLFDANENIEDFEKALALEKSRLEGKNIPPTNNILKSIKYKEAALFHKRIEKFLEKIPKERIFIGLQEELLNSPKSFLAEIEHFLRVSPFKEYNFKQVNSNKSVKNLGLHRSIKSPSGLFKNLIKVLIPSKKIRERVAEKIYNLNFEETQRIPVSEELRKQLNIEFEPSIKKLSNLINKDLNHWK